MESTFSVSDKKVDLTMLNKILSNIIIREESQERKGVENEENSCITEG